MHQITLPIRAGTLAAALVTLSAPAAAEMEVSVYGGWQTAPHSDVTIEGDDVVPDADFTAGWDGDSLSAPPYWGLRATWWRTDSLGFGIDINHAKVYADEETLDETGYERFEFTDGLNIVTVNAYRRWNDALGPFTPYLGAGLGVSVPYVELNEGTSQTEGYQLTGPAAALIAGLSYPIDDSWSVFGEYKGTYSMNSADLDTGGELETDIVTNAVNLGISFRF